MKLLHWLGSWFPRSLCSWTNCIWLLALALMLCGWSEDIKVEILPVFRMSSARMPLKARLPLKASLRLCHSKVAVVVTRLLLPSNQRVLIWRINWKGKEILKSVPIFDQICLTGRPIVQLLRLWRLVRVGWLTPCNRWSERSVAIFTHAIAALARNLVSIMLVYRWKRNAFGVKILCVFRNIYRQDRWAKSETVPVGCAVSWWCWRQGSSVPPKTKCQCGGNCKRWENFGILFLPCTCLTLAWKPCFLWSSC